MKKEGKPGRHWIQRWLGITQIRIEFDFDYGMDRRAGWSVTIDGAVLSMFYRWLIVALIKAIWKQIKYRWDTRGEKE